VDARERAQEEEERVRPDVGREERRAERRRADREERGGRREEDGRAAQRRARGRVVRAGGRVDEGEAARDRAPQIGGDRAPAAFHDLEERVVGIHPHGGRLDGRRERGECAIVEECGILERSAQLDCIELDGRVGVRKPRNGKR
jgi:hypothetical protein